MLEKTNWVCVKIVPCCSQTPTEIPGTANRVSLYYTNLATYIRLLMANPTFLRRFDPTPRIRSSGESADVRESELYALRAPQVQLYQGAGTDAVFCGDLVEMSKVYDGDHAVELLRPDGTVVGKNHLDCFVWNRVGLAYQLHFDFRLNSYKYLVHGP